MPSAAGTSIDWLPPGPQIIQGRPLDVDDVHVRRDADEIEAERTRLRRLWDQEGGASAEEEDM